jgi:cullin 3
VRDLIEFELPISCRCTYNVCVGHGGEVLYTQVATTMAAEVEKLAGSLENTASAPDDEFLRELLGRWKKHSNAVTMIRDVVMYMERTFLEFRHKAPVPELGLRAWRDGMLRPDGEVRPRLRAALLQMAGRDRAGEAVDVPLCDLMAGATKMLVEVGDGLYEEVLEAPFLDEVRRLCAGESVRLLALPCGCGEYLRTVESMMDAGKARVSRFLDAQTEEKVAAVVLAEMVETNVARLVGMEGSGLASMLVDGRYWDLTRMHRLLGRVQGGVPAMRDCMNVHFQEIRNTAGDDERLLSREKERYMEMINGVFRGEVSFHAALDSCFT